VALWDQMTDAKTMAGKLWAWESAGFRESTYGDLVHHARSVAAGLRRRGVKPGELVASVITNGADVAAGVMGTWFAGATVVSLPIIARGMTIAAYVRQLNELCRALDTDFLVAEERFFQFMPTDAGLEFEVVGYRELLETPELAEPNPPALDSTVLVQFSSGTTAEPRGVMLSGRAVEAHLEALTRRLEIDPERDVGYTWLPLSHDMGFVGCGLLSWFSGMAGVISLPERFLQSPRTWFDDCAEFGATVTVGPPSALALAARAELTRRTGGPLSLRLCLVGAEQIDWEVLVEAAEAFSPRGMTLDVFTTAYGLAETTLAVSLGDLNAPPRYLDVAAEDLLDGKLSTAGIGEGDTRRLVSTGAPLEGVTTRVDARDGLEVGEVLVRGPGNATGYLGNRYMTEKCFVDGEVHTSDLGFTHDGELYLTGRSDDLLIVAGRNVYVHEVEVELDSEPGIRKGNCAIVDAVSDDRPRVVLVAEVESDAVDHRALALRLRKAAMERSGLPIDDCVFLPRGMFPKTPSGKVQRYRCRRMLGSPGVGSRVSLTPSR
jgi:fatty-acyl-CoA synthase